jgi:hypothetical protein
MIRYIVVPMNLDAKHPQWPNQLVFYIKDLSTGLLSLAHYTSYDAAEKVAHRKNRLTN